MDRRVFAVLKVLRHFEFLGDSVFDIFNRTAHRKCEWARLAEYETTLDELLHAQVDFNLVRSHCDE